MDIKTPNPPALHNAAGIKETVQAFYDQVGWQQTEYGVYQNTIYEDLRPVAREYIHRCHLRVLRHLNPVGKYLLDAGSGPIQYAEYHEYSRGYQFRVCADISWVALQEARQRIGAHGLFVVADVACLPFKTGCFQGIVSLHTIHHLPQVEHVQAYKELYRVLSTGSKAVVVNGWKVSPLMRLFDPLVQLVKRSANHNSPQADSSPEVTISPSQPQGTFVNKNNAAWLKKEIGRWFPLEIYCWRSVSVGFLRALIHPRLGGGWILKAIYRLEELFPVFFGEKGQYPLVVFRKSTITQGAE